MRAFMEVVGADLTATDRFEEAMTQADSLEMPDPEGRAAEQLRYRITAAVVVAIETMDIPEPRREGKRRNG